MADVLVDPSAARVSGRKDRTMKLNDANFSAIEAILNNDIQPYQMVNAVLNHLGLTTKHPDIRIDRAICQGKLRHASNYWIENRIIEAVKDI